jgi:hypothetical protein
MDKKQAEVIKKSLKNYPDQVKKIEKQFKTHNKGKHG